jgi:hypothetical protein
VSAILGAVPLVVALRTLDEGVLFPAIFVAAIFLLMGNAPVNAIIVNAVSPGLRSTAMATTILAIHFLGDAISIYLVGKISTWFAERVSAGFSLPPIAAPIADMLGMTADKNLSIAMLLAPAALVVGGILFFLGLKPQRRQRE